MNEEARAATRKKILHCAAILMAICLVSGSGVGILYSVAKPEIERNQRMVFQTALAQALGAYDRLSELGTYPEETREEEKVYEARAGQLVRYAAMGKAQGYQSTVKVVVSIEAGRPQTPLGFDPEIYRMAVVSSEETPGLGENIKKVEKEVSLWSALWAGLTGAGAPEEQRRPAFQEQFSGLRLSELPATDEQWPGRIKPVTGATITSKAVVRAMREAAERVIERTRVVYGSAAE